MAINKKLSAIISSTLPDFVGEDYPVFVKFVEAYAEFLELKKNPQDVLTNLLDYNDLDKTLDEFVSQFETSYLKNFPKEIAANKRLAIKHISDLYNSKGTEQSYRLLFRLLFNEEIELFLPKTQILRVSDGKWSQRYSVKVKLISGSLENSVGKVFKITRLNSVTTSYVNNIAHIDGNVYEIFTSKIDKNYVIGDRLIGIDFVAEIIATTV